MPKRERTPLPFVKFCFDDFFEDPAVSPMTNEQVGAFMRMLRAGWIAPTPGILPDDNKYLASVCRWTLPEWLTHREAMARPWVCHDGIWEQKRIIREYAEAADRSRVKAENGYDGAVKRWQTHGRPIQDVDVDLNEDRKRKDLESTSTPIARDLPTPVNGHVKTRGAFSEGINGVNRTKEAQRQIEALAKAKSL